MANSLLRHNANAQLRIFCHDTESLSILKKYCNPKMKIYPISELHRKFPILDNIIINRPRLNYLYSITPFLISYFWDANDTEAIAYIDADIYVYENLESINPINFDVAITPHRFRKEIRNLEKFGKYNVGIVHFKHNINSNVILKFWLDSCISSTSTFTNIEIFGDQKYLDYFDKHGKVFEIEHLGFNAAPWNCNDVVRNNLTGKLEIYGEDLHYFHFSGLKRFRFFATLSFLYYSWKPSYRIKALIYKPYIDELSGIEMNIFGSKSYDTRRINFRQLIQFVIAKDVIFNL